MNDLEFAVRQLWKSPGFTTVAVLTLALGIGANAMMFAVLHAVLLKSLPYPEPDRMVIAWGSSADSPLSRNAVSLTDAMDFRSQSTQLDGLATVTSWFPILSDSGAEAERIGAAFVSDDFFRILKATPLLGRTFGPEEQTPGKDRVAVLSYSLWQRKFNGDPQAIGRTIQLNSRAYVVIGVLQPEFKSLPAMLLEKPAELYRPMAEVYDNTSRGSRHLYALGRLKPGANLEVAQHELVAIAARLAKEFPADNSNRSVNLVNFAAEAVSDLRQPLLLLNAAVALVLLIACANVANLLLARSAQREREMAIRAALGAQRGRLIRTVLAECLVLSAVGTAVGLGLAAFGTRFINTVGTQLSPLLGGVEINLPVLAFAAGALLITLLAFGLVPALLASKPDLTASLKSNSGGNAGGHRSRLRGSLIVAEVALSLVLLVGAGLLIKSLARLRGIDPGFDSSSLLTMNLLIPSAKYPETEKQIAFYDEVTRRIQNIAGVEAAGVTTVLPLSKNFDGRTIQIDGAAYAVGQEPMADMYGITPGYQTAMRLRLKSGRFLAEHDDAKTPRRALVNQTMAAKLWPGRDPLGQRFKMEGDRDSKEPWFTVVGIVADVRHYSLEAAPPMQYYVPNAQFNSTFMTLVVRTKGDPASFVQAVRNEVLAVDREQPAFNIATMDQVVDTSLALRRFAMLLLGAFAGLALVLAAVGVYGVISYTTAQRTREFGIRLALGAGPAALRSMVLRQGLALTGLGLAIGGVLAFATTHFMRSLLFEVSPFDGGTFAAVAAVLLFVTLLACYLPARRATKADPLVALRAE